MKSVSYFGFGANAHPHMIEAIIGRIPDGEPAVLQGYALAVQELSQVPDIVLQSAPEPVSPQQILRRAWGNDFRSYTMRRDETRDVWGRVWHISREERELIAAWELIPFGWSSNLPAHALLRTGSRCVVETEWVYDQDVERVVDGRRYPYFIVPEIDLLNKARTLRSAL